MDIIELIKTEAKHPDYSRVCELKSDYYAWVTGVGLDARLKRFVKRETQDEFEQRVRLTCHIIPSAIKRHKNTFQKGLTSGSIMLSYGNTDGKSEPLNEILSNFYSDKTPEDYLRKVFIDKSFVEPNGWLVVDFTETDGTEFASPYPFEVTTEQAHDFKFNNGVLEYLFICLPKTYTENGKSKEGKRFTLYQSDRAFIAEQVSADKIEIYLPTAWQVYEVNGLKFFKSNKKGIVYQLIEPEPYNLLPPVAKRWGYIYDTTTDQRTFESILESARPWFDKSLKAVSEFDLGVTLHAFPQKFQYAPRCDAKNCNGGQDISTGGTCEVCHGTGLSQVHVSGQDIVTLSMPKDLESTFQLSNLIHYAALPIDVLNFQREHVDRLIDEIGRSIFNVDKLERAQVTVTATQSTYSREDEYSTLRPFAWQYADLWKYCIEQVAEITNLNEKLIVSAIVSYDFKLKTADELYKELELATTANAGQETISAIKYDIASVKFNDSPIDMKRYETMMFFEPFGGKTESEKIAIVATLPTNNTTRVLYTFYSDIFKAIELEKGLDFYQLAPQKQKGIIDEYITKFTTKPIAF